MELGQIVTFYSYKGGVGRTMALANVAVLLSLWGYKTLIIDWDLEAPGLEHFFKEFIDFESAIKNKGVVDLLYSVPSSDKITSELVIDWRSLLVNIRIPNAKAPLYLLTAGSRGDEYFGKLRNFDLDKFYNLKQGGEFLENLRNEWKSTYDFILIDSRTGITDIGGICTIHLPDILVLLFTATDQGFQGVVDVAKRSAKGRRELPVDRLTLRTIPIPTRFDTDKEFKIAQKWLDDFSSQLINIYVNWLPKNVKPRDFLEITKLPYVAYFSFGEKLAVLEQGTNDPGGLGYACETLAAIIANKLESVDKLVTNRSMFVQTALKSKEVINRVIDQKEQLITIDSFNKTEALTSHKGWLESKGRLGKRLDLSNALLKDIDLSDADLRRCILSGAYLAHATLINADLSGADLTDADLEKANLIRANLSKSQLQNANLTNAVLIEAIIRESNLESSNLHKANLMGADLSHSRLRGANLDETNFTDANMSDVRFIDVNLRRTNLKNAVLQGSDLSNVKELTEDQLSGTDINGAKLPESIGQFELLDELKHRELGLNIRYIAINLIWIFAVFIEVISQFFVTKTQNPSFETIEGLIVPFLGINVSISWFYLVVPISLFIFYLYIQSYIQGVWIEISLLPSIFPDGKALHRKVRPEFVSKIVRLFSRSDKRDTFINLSHGIVAFSLWFAVPTTILYYAIKFTIIFYQYDVDKYSSKSPKISLDNDINPFLIFVSFLIAVLAFSVSIYFIHSAHRIFSGSHNRPIF